MKDKEIDDITKLYTQFGYSPVAPGVENTLTFVLRTGAYLNCDIVHTENNTKEADKTNAILKENGYDHTRSVCFHDIDRLEDKLFKEYFTVESANLETLKRYKDFTNNIQKSIGFPYEYIPSDYIIDNQNSPTKDNVVNYITETINTPGVRFILVEAAAGFGKTCTSYEIAQRLSFNNKDTLTFLIELSRNREARVFKHVLLDEVNRNLRNINLSLVIKYIKKGKITLIIDGFDELISSKKEKDYEESFLEAEPMLDTLSSLLTENVKIVLTTRKTAILSGEDFHLWLEKRNADFYFTRIKLNEPTLENWVGPDRAKKIRSLSVHIQTLSNPILLGIFKHATSDEFTELTANNTEVFSTYIQKLLTREQERQDLLMSPTEQIAIIKTVAAHFLENDISCDRQSNLKKAISSSNSQTLESTLEKYPRDKPMLQENLLDKLTNHAFLDRKTAREDLIGFVNDIFFGYFMSDIICQSSDPELCVEAYFIELCIASCMVKEDAFKKKLWEKLEFSVNFLEQEDQFSFEFKLFNTIRRKYHGIFLTNEHFTKGSFHPAAIFSESNFTSCNFQNIHFNFNQFKDSTFINCRFFECSSTPNTKTPRIIDCISEPDFFTKEEDHEDTPKEKSALQANIKAVLEKFWPPGRSHYTPHRKIRTLYLGAKKHNRDSLSSAIYALRRNDIISIKGDTAILNQNKAQQIREILERDTP